MFELFLQLVRDAGDGTKDLVIVYFVYMFIGLAAKYGFLGGILYLIYRIFRLIMNNIGFGQRVSAIWGDDLVDRGYKQNNFIEWLTEAKRKAKEERNS